MHKQNSIPLSSTPHIDSGFYDIEVVYQSADGTETSDISQARKDYDGNPLVIELKASSKILPSVAKCAKPFTLSPNDPMSRTQCLEVFGMLNKRPSSPISLVDKMDATKYAENVSGAISNAIASAVEKVSNQQSVIDNSHE